MATGRLHFQPKALTIARSDLERSVQFYETVLGAFPMPTEDGIRYPWYRLGSLVLTLMPNAEHPSPAEFPEHAMGMLWLEVADLEAAEARFVEHRVEVIQPSDGQFMLVADPDGLVIEV